MPDPQRQRVYDAESCLDFQWWYLHRDRPPLDAPLSWEALVAFCRRVYADALRRPYDRQWRTARVRPRLVIEPTDAPASFAEPRCDRLCFNDAGRTTWVALHEVAHLLADREHEPAHGWRFAYVLRQMAARHVHPDASAMLYDIYRWYGVAEGPFGARVPPAVPYPWYEGAREAVRVRRRVLDSLRRRPMTGSMQGSETTEAIHARLDRRVQDPVVQPARFG